MPLDWHVCSRARLTRDARFDGKFYIGVLSTGVYCRPICPARTCKESNVRYYPTAAAAAEAGFRPCLRCRPECSPGTPAWRGTSNTVSRALRLISEGLSEASNIEDLARHVGVGSRHLRRLFLQHLGATPSAVIHTHRLHFAKKLIDETTLPMNELALASGFGCVRRFNAAIRNTYHRTPSQLRRLARQTSPEIENQYNFHLDYRPPFDWENTLQYLAENATPGVESIEQGTYRRSIVIGQSRGFLQLTCQPERNAILLRVQTELSSHLFGIIERVRAMLDLNADWQSIATRLRKTALLANAVERHPGLRVPGCWSGFEVAVRSLLVQQAGTPAATRLMARLAEQYGEPCRGCEGVTRFFPSPEVLSVAHLASLGLSQRAADSIQSLAGSVLDGKVVLERSTDLDADVVRLQQHTRLDATSISYLTMRVFGDPDAFPAERLGAIGALESIPASALHRSMKGWRPWRAYGFMYLWLMASEEPHRDAPVNGGFTLSADIVTPFEPQYQRLSGQKAV